MCRQCVQHMRLPWLRTQRALHQAWCYRISQDDVHMAGRCGHMRDKYGARHSYRQHQELSQEG
jgi:hypothetical protein